MNENEGGGTLTRREVATVIGAVLLTLSFASFAFVLQNKVEVLAANSATKAEVQAAVNDLQGGQERILGLLCEDAANANKRACTR